MQVESRLHREILSQLEQTPAAAMYLRYRREVPEIVQQVASEHEIAMRRTGLRVRNRQNTADDWEFERLEAFAFSIDAGLDPALLEFAEVTVDNSGQRIFRWIRPIMMTEACLVCHGETIPTEVLDLLVEEYPNDEATGYFAYELGGAYSVTRMLD